MIRFLNRLIKMDDHRWPVKVHRWDLSLKTKGWADNIAHVLVYVSMDTDLKEGPEIDLDTARSRMLVLNRNHWKVEAATKTKLRTYLEVQEDSNRKALINANLSRAQRSLVAKLKLGILPLQIEIGRWKDVALENRYCRVCEEDVLENEYHFVMYCEGLTEPRTDMYIELNEKTDIDLYGPKEVVLKEMLSKNNIKILARHLETMWSTRREILYKREEEAKKEDVVVT